MIENRRMERREDGRMCYGVMLLGSMIGLLGIVGCQSGPVAAPVDVPVAEQTLTHVLNGWKGGATPESFQQSDPSIVVQDRDWQAGYTLISYESKGPGQAFDANLHCDVALTLREPGGKEVTKTVTYIVGTDPVLTVFRKIF